MRKFYWFILIFIVLLFPWILNVIACPAGAQPLGLLAGGVDYATFLGKIEYGRMGHWLYANRFTPEITQEVPIYFFYLLLGNIARWLGISTIWMFHIVRSLFGALALLMWWQFCKRFSNSTIVFLIGIFASCGLLYTISNTYEFVELTVAGRALFWSLWGFPHYALDFIGILLILKAYFDREHIITYSLLAGFLIGMVHPFLFLILLSVLLIHALWQKDFWAGVKIASLVVIGSLPFTIPMLISFTQVEWLDEWRRQTEMQFTWIETIYYHFFTFGLAGIIAWTSIYTFRKKDSITQFYYIWLALAIILSFLVPMPNQREFMMFATIPIAIIATPYIANFAKKHSTLRYNILLVSLVGISTFYAMLVAGMMFDYSNISYVSDDTIAAYKYLEKNSQPEDVVISTPQLGLYLPVYVDKPRPYVAHPSETMKAKERRNNVNKFFKENKEIDARWAMLQKEEDLPRLKQKPVYENPEIIIWKLKEMD